MSLIRVYLRFKFGEFFGVVVDISVVSRKCDSRRLRELTPVLALDAISTWSPNTTPQGAHAPHWISSLFESSAQSTS